MVLTIKAAKRTELGKNANRRLRNANIIPTNLVMPDENKSIPLSVPLSDVQKIYADHAHLVNVEVEQGKTHKAFVKGIEWDNLKDCVLHLDLLEAKLDRSITTELGLHFKGNAVGIQNGGVFVSLLSSIEVSGFPQDIPERIEVEIAPMDIGDSLTVADLDIPETLAVITRSDLRICEVHLAAKAKASATEDEAEEEKPLEAGD